MWLAGLLGLGADRERILSLPATLRLGSARIDWTRRQDGGTLWTDLEVVDVDPAIDGTFDDLVRHLEQTELPSDLRAAAREVLHWRRRGDAGTEFSRQRFWGAEFTDTLIDVVGGVLAWDLLGRPRVTTTGIVDAGTATEGIREVLGPVPHHSGSCADPLVTATGAALLRHFWTPVPVPEEPPLAACEIRSTFARRHGLGPMVASLHDSPV